MGELIEVIAIPTRDSAEELRASVGSCIEESARWGRRLEVVVFDDSRREGSLCANRTILENAARSGNVVRYATPQSRRRFVRALIQDDRDTDIVELGVLGASFDSRYGAVRNAMALELSGRAFLSLDDDMSLRGFRLPESTDTTKASLGDPTEVVYFATERDARAHAERQTIDVIAAHQKLLGSGPEGERVVATWTGFYGYAGTPSPLLYLASDGPSFDRLRDDSPWFEACARSGQIIRAVGAPTTATGGFWTTGTAAYGADPTPPFLPILRGEGLVFGALLAACKRSVLGYVPAVVEHRARERTGLGPLDFELPVQRSLAPLVGAFIHMCAANLRARQTPVDLQSLSGSLASVAESDELPVYAVQLQRARNRVMLGRVRALLANHTRPSAWQSAAERFLHAADNADRDSDFSVPTDLAAEVGAGSAIVAMRQTILRFAGLLGLWAGLHLRARSLVASGLGAAERI